MSTAAEQGEEDPWQAKDEDPWKAKEPTTPMPAAAPCFTTTIPPELTETKTELEELRRRLQQLQGEQRREQQWSDAEWKN
jgi:hypothetical protein